MTHAEMLDELREELSRGRVVEAQLRAKDSHLDGLCDPSNQTIYVWPAPSVVETLLHELMHRRWPSWGERRVLRESRRVLARLDDNAIARWYRDYQRVKRVRLRPVQSDDE
jgi:hypothetical protein